MQTDPAPKQGRFFCVCEKGAPLCNEPVHLANKEAQNDPKMTFGGKADPCGTPAGDLAPNPGWKLTL